ncbi:Clan MH, family M20, peptidase T-like metallopeptidase [Trichomonas vaginalis G3]|uniref:Clan MH, family M20, peptidase T-like metallopeptidase n=1 Tax=Trichomonas vaginalis (strain ATCC PRA-98 / G3) TaxID=412133 RepID=A2EM36_TRIV3|nr:Clan MH, family M20, peptidase T-like metallopeptidase [Trichomonas vaginalis G3]EAY06295.1 Clan MH, family M20, peptidase T-like metallopeptidase [Trichomonas vaginalis G3]KAI5503373.1 Clan MH, family M20, peptidase T-like metallopeptidase [Trichomonas vaginalis G3]|eukprot:XP_001318518.1 Clan MH, family M20, peptidase T-like metallopeptidase [Trichomonas vaginalis G3]
MEKTNRSIHDLQDNTLTEEEKTELITFFQKIVQIPSVNPEGKESLVAVYLEEFFDKYQIPYEKIEVENGRYDLLAKVEGETSEDAFLFTGHMDVVPVSAEEEKRWILPPFGGEIKEGKLYGRGSVDMKSGLCCAMFALAYLKKYGYKPKTDIFFLATIDEEDYMKGSKAALNYPALKKVKGCIVCEPTGLHLCTAGKGRTWATVRVKGETAHGSLPSAGNNAIYQALDLTSKIRSQSFCSPETKFAFQTFWRVLAIHAQVEPKVVPDSCELTVDARLGLSDQPSMIWETLDKLIEERKKEEPSFSAEYVIEDERPPWKQNSTDRLIILLKKAMEEKQLDTNEEVFSGTTDATFLRKLGMETVIIGPGDLSLVHRENENISLEEVVKACEFYLEVIRQI